ncbi:MAG: hypothetical protein JWM09_1216, partial [Francisellaceae bacterium]|nr:hypothetical protein [Francisellaceae bacterium]
MHSWHSGYQSEIKVKDQGLVVSVAHNAK